MTSVSASSNNLGNHITLNMSSKRVAFKVHGTVQGVGFRDFTQKCATGYGLMGWTRNTTCGRVEGEVQGDGESIKKFMQQIDKGPRMAHVVKVEKREMEPLEGEAHFSVMRTSESNFHTDT
ncbi:hypothetical protein N7494_012129 [Penicillium frequentans]|uniref:acylphosphatase n=1 Tax=Penicillium frequentans TaxID=3151616 RepID=A0AAD6CNN2_9EURO|nr:hypothetical protein N7494_012129 [Penicillium glabrum]